MSSLSSNDRIIFEQSGEYLEYTCHYRDDYDNEWVIEIVGTKEEVESIAEKKRLILNAYPEESLEFQDIVNKLSERSESSASENGDVPEEILNQFPGMTVAVSLKNISRADQTHAIDIRFDPRIFKKRHRWRFDLNVATTDFAISVTNIQGQVNWYLWPKNGSRWFADVWRVQDGNPTEYDMVTVGVRVD
ncbi:MAG: hypothetical protein K1X65_25295 [Caldilineales bacterium]|nr:hypothetical protein [Caldilineales bacterium]